jgi:hypothetical protein
LWPHGGEAICSKKIFHPPHGSALCRGWSKNKIYFSLKISSLSTLCWSPCGIWRGEEEKEDIPANKTPQAPAPWFGGLRSASQLGVRQRGEGRGERSKIEWNEYVMVSFSLPALESGWEDDIIRNWRQA